MGEECETIITDMGRAIGGAVAELNKEFFQEKVSHVLDFYHVNKNLSFKEKRSYELFHDLV